MKKFLLSVGVAAMALSANAADGDYWISGQFCSWGGQNMTDDAYKFKATDTEGVYKVEFQSDALPAPFAGEFLIVAEKDGAPDWNNGKLGSNGDKVVAGEDYYYVAGAGNFILADEIKNPVITLDTNEGFIKVEGESVANEYETIYMVGDFTDGGTWDESTTAFPLTANADKTEFTGTLDVTKAPGYVKFKAGNVVYGGDPVAETENIIVEGPSNESYVLAQAGKAYEIPTGKYAITVKLDYNAETGTVVFAAEGAAIEGVEADNNVAPVYYNLQGVRVDNAANGLYIVVRGDKAAKEFVR